MKSSLEQSRITFNELVHDRQELLAALKRMVTAYTIGGITDAKAAKAAAKAAIAAVEGRKS